MFTFLQALLEPILNSCEEEHVRATICIAIGRHRQMGEEELAMHLGEDICRRYGVIQHDPFDDEACVDLGETRRGTPIRVNRIVFDVDVVLGRALGPLLGVIRSRRLQVVLME